MFRRFFSELQNAGEILTQHGAHMVRALAILIVGMLVVRWIDKGLRRLIATHPIGATICNLVYFLLVAAVVSAALVMFGYIPINVIRLLGIIVLVVVAVRMFLRPFIPTLPFKVGNTVKTGDLLGRVEAITFINTRLRTFDGKTVFVPNTRIFKDVVINYHFTQTRRVKINVNIRYDQDLLKAKQVLEAVMVEDPRVKAKPSAVVYVLNLAASWVELGGRCWVDNQDYWFVRCDLVEKTKLRFDREGIRFAFPQLDLHVNDDDRVLAAGSGVSRLSQPAWSVEPTPDQDDRI
jgi:small conductance mechanosensitive channel